jgi:hypothetical protein
MYAQLISIYVALLFMHAKIIKYKQNLISLIVQIFRL